MSTATARPTLSDQRIKPGRAAVAALVVLGPIIGLISPLTNVYNGATDNAATMVAKVFAHEGQFTLYVWFDVLFAVVYAPAILALSVRALASSRRLGGFALGVNLTAFFAMATAASSQDYALLYGAHSKTDPAVLTKLIDKGSEVPVFGIPLVYGLVGQLIGLILLGLALSRIKGLAGWPVVASAPVLLLGYSLGVPVLIAAGYLALTVGAAVTAQVILRDGIGWARSA